MIRWLRELTDYHRWHRRRWYPAYHQAKTALMRAIGLCSSSIPATAHAFDERGWCWACRSWSWRARVRRVWGLCLQAPRHDWQPASPGIVHTHSRCTHCGETREEHLV